MPRKPISRTYIAEGFVNDCEDLIQRCVQAEVLNYHVFCNIWKDMNFVQIFFGRTLGSELAELSEEVLYVAKRYLIGDSNNFEETIAGLFLVYGLMNLQPYCGFAPLRLVPSDIVTIKNIEMICRRDSRYDALYILGHLLTHGPVEFHAELRDFGFEIPIKKYLLGFTGTDAPRVKGVFSARGEELDLMREVSSLARKYSEAKTLLTKSGIWTQQLNYSNDSLPKELEASYKKVLSGMAHDTEQDSDPEEHLVVSKVRAIKDKAMALTVNAKHWMGVVEPQKETKSKTVPSRKSKRKRPPKRGNKGKLERRRKIQALVSSSSSDDDSVDLPLSDEDLQETLDSSHEEKLKKIDKDIQNTQEEINIQIESLPLMISVDQNKEFEIEFIDMQQVQDTNDINKETTQSNTLETINDEDSKEKVAKRKNDKTEHKGERISPVSKKKKDVFSSSEDEMLDLPLVKRSPKNTAKKSEVNKKIEVVIQSEDSLDTPLSKRSPKKHTKKLNAIKNKESDTCDKKIKNKKPDTSDDKNKKPNTKDDKNKNKKPNTSDVKNKNKKPDTSDDKNINKKPDTCDSEEKTIEVPIIKSSPKRQLRKCDKSNTENQKVVKKVAKNITGSKRKSPRNSKK